MTSGGDTDVIRRISLIVPMLNEAAHVDDFVADVAAQDFDGEVELVVADGGSTDGSPELLRRAAERHGIALIVLDNPAGWVSHGLNRCVAIASGDLLVRLDCHSRYPVDYLRLCATAAEETGADVVGGVIVADGKTLVQRAVAAAMESPFGGIGFYRILSDDGGALKRPAEAFGLARERQAARNRRLETDTVTFGAFRPATFESAGLFDETLLRNQDDELNLRVRLRGGKVILDPAIRVFYRPRGSLRRVFRQYYEYGYWKIAVIVKHRQPPGPRSAVPALFVLSAGSLTLLSAVSPWSRRLLALELAAYGLAAVAAATIAVRRRNDAATLVPAVVAVFPAFHVGYGAGMVAGAARAAFRSLRGRALRF